MATKYKASYGPVTAGERERGGAVLGSVLNTTKVGKGTKPRLSDGVKHPVTVKKIKQT